MSSTLVRLTSGEIAVRVPDNEAAAPAAAPPARKAKARKPSGRPNVPPPPSPTATADELAAFENHVWRGCFICVIYLPRNMKRCQETIDNVVAHGFPAPYMVPGVTPRPGDTVHDCVCRAHHNTVGWFLSKGLDSRFHLLVLEDDALFVFPDSEPKLAAALETLEQWGKWGSLHVGHIAMGPVYPLTNGLVRSMNPCTSHCYVLNRRTVRSIYALVPERLWKRPMMVEGHWAYPADERFAMMPALATQSVMPKEMASMPIVRDMCTYQDGEKVTMVFGSFLTLCVVAALCYVLLLAARWPLKVLSRAQLLADSDNQPPCEMVPMTYSVTLAAWLTVSVLLLHAIYYVGRRFTCSFAERRHWRTYALDAARTSVGLAVAALFEFGYLLRVQPTEAAQQHAAETGVDELSRAAAVLLVVPFFVWPLSLAVHNVLTDWAGNHRRLQSIAVSGRYSDPLSFLSASPGLDADQQTVLNRALANIVRPPALLSLPSFRKTESARLLATRSANNSCATLESLNAAAAAAVGACGGVGGNGAAAALAAPPQLTPLRSKDRTVSVGAMSTHSEAFTGDGEGAGGDARDALRALEEAVAAADSPERLQSQPARLSWWLAQTMLWACTVAAAEAAVLGACHLLGSNGPIELAASAIARLLPWSCTRKEVGLCALGRLAVLVLATTLVDAQLRCAHFQHQPEEVRARAYDELGGRISRASSHVDISGLARSDKSAGQPSPPRAASSAGSHKEESKGDGRRGATEMV